MRSARSWREILFSNLYPMFQHNGYLGDELVCFEDLPEWAMDSGLMVFRLVVKNVLAAVSGQYFFNKMVSLFITCIKELFLN